RAGIRVGADGLHRFCRHRARSGAAWRRRLMAQLELVHPAPIDFDAPLSARGDHNVIAHMVSEGARVLDIGSGDGALISLLTRECGARARGLEIDPAK